MENDDEFIPSSQPVTTNRKISEQKKRKKSKLTLKSSNSAKSSKTLSGMAGNSTNLKKPPIEVNIYAGLLDETIDRNAVTSNRYIDPRRDMFGDVKQLELGNLSNTPPSKKVTVPIAFDSPEGLQTVKSFIETHRFDRNEENTSRIRDNAPQCDSIRRSRSEMSFARHEAQQLFDESLQFSEWPIEQQNASIVEMSPDLRRSRSELSFATKEAHQLMNESFQFSEWPIEQQNSPADAVRPQERVSQHLPLEQSCVSSIVDSILNDFDDEFVQSEEPFLKSPPMILSRKRNPRIYKRVYVSKNRQLMWDSESCDKESIPKMPFNINMDVDLDSSHRIIENITNLSSFYTQSQTFELDFDRGLSRNSDELENDNVAPNIIDLDDENVSPCRNNTQIDRVDFDATSHFWNDDDDFLHKVNSPSTDLLRKSTAAKRNCEQISTPNSLAKSNKRFKVNYVTPSTSKTFMENEQRDFLPKRLHFEGDGDNQTMSLKPLGAKPMNRGFSTAAGTTVATSTNAMKKQLRLFAGIETECQQVVECHGSKSPIKKMDDKNQCDNQLGSRPICDQKVMPTDGFYKNLCTTGGFLTGRGHSAAISAAKLKNSRQLFKNVFDEFRELDTTADTVHENVKPSIYAPQMDFTAASASNFTTKANTLQKYREIEVDIFKDCEAGPSTKAPIESPIVCKTPLSKYHRNTNRFMTSTPTLDGRNYSNSPCITPINESKRMAPMEKEQESIKSLNFTGDECNRNILFDVDPKPIHRIPTEAILDVSEINPLDVSISQTDILCIPVDIKLAREEELSKQQVNAMKKPHVILPKMGSLCLEKLLSCGSQIARIKTIKKFQVDELRQLGLPDNVIELTIENATKIKFDMWHYYSTEECRSNVDGIELPDDIKLIMDRNCRVGIREISSAFLMCPVVDPKHVPDNWIRNSFKWIVVKLAAMDRAFAYRNDGRYLTPENVMLQLKYRYDREIDKAERPAIRRIVEMDDLASKRMVLFVSAIYNENETPRALQLCDGWYAIRTTSLDPTLVKAVQNKKIEIGTKLIIQGAELLGCTEGAHPLEMSSAAALKIAANSTRRAKWDLKLGFCREPWPFAISLNSVSEQGGLISRMIAFVLRVYPPVYIVKETVGDSTKSSTRSSKMEKRFRRNEDNKRFDMAEKFYNEANDEIEKEDKATRQTMDLPTQSLKEIDNGEDLWKLLEISHDAELFELNLTMSQKQLLQDHQTRMNDKKVDRIHKLASEKLKNWSTVTKTTPMLKVRLIDAKNPIIPKMAILNIWNAAEDMIDIRENTFIEIQKAMAKGMIGRDIHITCYGTSSIRELSDYYPTERHVNLRRKLTNLHEIDARTFKPLFNEFDTIGYVLEMTEPNPGQFQSIFFIDAHKNILCIKFWHSVKEYGYDDVVQTGRFLCISHLDWRPQHTKYRNNFPQAFANDYTMFTENPKENEKIIGLERLRQEFQTLNLDNYILECRSELEKDVSNISNVSNTATTPLRPSNSNLNNVIRTPIDCSPSPSQSVDHRISRLRSYGNLAVPSKNIYLGTQKNLGTKFRTPVRNSAKNREN